MAAPARCTIIWDNRHFEAAALTPSSEVDTLPAANVQDPLRSRPWRTVGLTGEYLVMDLGAIRPCSCLALIDHNLTLEGEITLQAASASGFAAEDLVFNQTWPAWEEIIGAGEMGAGQQGAGQILEADRPWLAPSPIRLIYFPPEAGQDPVQARWWRLLLSDPANPDGWFQVGRIYLCLFDELSKQFAFGWEADGEDLSEVEYSVGGQPWTNVRPVHEVRRLSWSSFREADLYWLFLLFRKKVGLSKDFLLDMLPGGLPSQRFFNLLYGRFRSLPAPRAAGPGLWELEAEFIESH